MGENEMDDIFNEALETIEPIDNSDSGVYENDEGQVFDKEEVDEWGSLVDAANHLIQEGKLNSEDALGVVQGVFYEQYLPQKDMQEAIKSGLRAEDISDKAWEMYHNNIGKMTLRQAVDSTDDFLDGFYGDDRPALGKRVSVKERDAFLSGLSEYGW